MVTSTELTSVPFHQAGSFPDQLRLAVTAYLTRFKGSSREHTESDLRCYLSWCAERGLDPLAVQRHHLELYIRWLQETRRFKPSTISRRFSVTAGFYRTCAIHGVLEHSPAEHVRRPTVSAESPTLGFTHLQFEALLTTAPPTLAEPEHATLVSVDCFAGRSVEAKRRLYGEIVDRLGRWESLATMSRSPFAKAVPKTGVFGAARLRVTSTSGSTSRSGRRTRLCCPARGNHPREAVWASKPG